MSTLVRYPIERQRGAAVGGGRLFGPAPTTTVDGAATLTAAGTLTADATTSGIQGRTATVAETASGTSITGTLPTDRQTGDYVIAHFSMSSTTAQFTGPGGSWTQIVAPTQNAATDVVAVYGQFDPASAPSASTSGAADRQTCIMQAYSGVNTGTPVDVAAQINTGTLPLTISQVTTVTDGARLISGTAANFSTGTWTFPSGMTAVANHTSGVGNGAGYADEVRATAGATGTRQWTASTLQSTVGYLFALRPTSGATTIDGTATLAGAGTLSATVTLRATASPTGAGVLAASATVLVPGTATLIGAGALAASAGGTQSGTATLTGAGVVTAIVTQRATTTPTGAGVLTAAATVRVPATASMTGAGALTAAAVVRVPGTASLAGAGVLTAVSGAAQFGTATLTGAGTLSATATVQAQGAATLTGVGVLGATPTLRINGTASLAGAGTLLAAVVIGATATLTGTGVLGAAGTSAEPYVPAYVGVDSYTRVSVLDHRTLQPAAVEATTTATHVDL